MFSNDHFLRELGPRLPTSVTVPDGAIPPAARRQIVEQVIQANHTEICLYIDYMWLRHNRRPRNLPLGGHNRIAFAMVSANVETQLATGFNYFHLIYAYLLENTRFYEIFGRVLQGFNDGETLGVASSMTRAWLETTEACFYRQQSAHDHSSLQITSDRRDDGRAIRRNAYYRMFGMDLNHGTHDNKPYPYIKPKSANRDFVSTLEELLRQVWIAIVNEGSTTGNPTDDAEIAHLARRLRVMLTNRQLEGTLLREEFAAIHTMDWLRFIITYDSTVVNDLRANAASESERLTKIAERVGLPSHGKSDDYFELAVPMAQLLELIEDGTLSNRVEFLGFGPITNIINHWSRATGKVLKKMPRPIVRQTAA